MHELTIAVVGATGAVGTEFLSILEERYEVLPKIKALASSRSAGKVLNVGGREIVVEETTEMSFQDVDIAFISVSTEISRKFAPVAVAAGAVVIDVGINRIKGKEGKSMTVGDVAFEDVKKVAGYLSPVPGGVGPMTVAMMMRNTVDAAER